MASHSLPHLGTALRRVRTSHVGRRARVTPWFREAQCLHTNEAVKELCEACSQRVHTASLLTLGDRPLNRQLLALLRATLCLLGEEEDYIRNGQSVKSRLRETSAGKSRLLERIKNFQVEHINKDHVCRAEKQLSCCNAGNLEMDGGTAARQLHDWCQGMVRELSQHIWDEEEEGEEEVEWEDEAE